MFLSVVLFAVVGLTSAQYHNGDYYSTHEDYHHPDEELRYRGPPAPLKEDGTVDYTPEVKEARAAHFAALDSYRSSFPARHQFDHSPYNHYHSVPFSHFFNPNPAPVKHDGSVDDLPEVKAARAAHLARFNQASHRYKRSYAVGAPLKHDGTVDETPEVKQAKAVHLAAVAQARSYDTHSYDHESFPAFYGGHKYFEPAPLNHDGTVADTDAIKHAKAALFKAHNEAAARIHYYPSAHDHYYPSHDNYHHSHEKKYHGPPAPLNHDGTVAETPEVKHAKALHFQLYNKFLHRYKRDLHFQPAPLNPDGTVAETPEVARAKEAFFAAHAAEMAHADPSWVEPEYNDEPQYNNYVEPVHYSFPTSSFHSKPAFESPEYHRPASVFTPTFSKRFEPAPLNHDGTVADTPAVKAAKAVHFAAYQHPHLASFHSPAPSFYHHTPVHSAPAPVHNSLSHYKHVVPAPLNHDGTVAETPEIRAAKAVHFAAHQAALSRAVPQKFSHSFY